MSTPPVLSVENLVAAFDTEAGRIRAVDHAGFELKQGEILGIVGESGCGKSVTALCIMQLLPRPSGVIESGKIIFNGMDLLSQPLTSMHTVRGRKIAMIFQEPMTALNPVHKVGKQIKEIYQLHFPGMTPAQMQAAAVEMLGKVGIADAKNLIKTYPHQLSGGMRQRVMIAMALACKPDILIADEPTTALDVTVQAQIIDLIKTLQKQSGMAVILITHDLGVIAENCNRAVVMYGGQVVEKARVRQLFKRPAHPYTKGLLRSIPSLAGDAKTMLPTIKGRVPSLEGMPSGCRFSTRCPVADTICNHAFPKDEKLEEDHVAACYFLERS